MKSKAVCKALSPFLLLVLLLFARSSFAQINWTWAASGGRDANQVGFSSGEKVDFDRSGNAYLVGAMSSPSKLGNLSPSSHGGADILIAKYDRLGHPMWAKTAGGPNDDVAKTVVVAPDGAVYVAGFFTGAAQFDSQIFNHFNNSFFLAKLDSNGNYLWIRDGDGIANLNPLFEPVLSVNCDSLGHVYLAGFCSGASQLIDTFYNTSPAHATIYVTQIDAATGNMNWIYFKRGTINNGSGSNSGIDVEVDPLGNLLFASTIPHVDTVINGPNSTTYYDNLLLGMLDVNGNLLWDREYGDTSNYVWGAHPHALSLDAGGNMWISGFYYKDFLLNPSPAAANGGGFMARLDPNNGNVMHAQAFQSSNSSLPFLNTCDYDFHGSLRIAGTLCGSVDFGGITIAPISPAFDCDNFVASYDTSGLLQWATRYGFDDYDNLIGSGAREHLYAVTGRFKDSLQFATHKVYADTFGTSANYLFIAVENTRLDVQGIQVPSVIPRIQIFPNPATSHLRIRADFPLGDYEIDVFSLNGVLMLHEDQTAGELLDVHALAAGTYFLRFRNAEVSTIQRFVKVD